MENLSPIAEAIRDFLACFFAAAPFFAERGWLRNALKSAPVILSLGLAAPAICFCFGVRLAIMSTP